MNFAVLVLATLCLFGIFAGGLTYAQLRAKGIVAPGARPID